MASTEQNKALVREILAAIDRGDRSVIDRQFSPAFQAHFPGTPGPMNREAFKEFLAVSRQGLPDGLHRVEDQVAEGDLVGTSGTFTGTHTGEFMGLPPTGRRVSSPFILLTRLTDGKVTEAHAQADYLGMMQQLGAIPSPEPAPATA